MENKKLVFSFKLVANLIQLVGLKQQLIKI